MDLAMLAAEQYYIEYGKEICEEDISALTPVYIPPNKREDNDLVQFWVQSILNAHRQLFTNKRKLPSSYEVCL